MLLQSGRGLKGLDEDGISPIVDEDGISPIVDEDGISPIVDEDGISPIVGLAGSSGDNMGPPVTRTEDLDTDSKQSIDKGKDTTGGDEQREEGVTAMDACVSVTVGDKRQSDNWTEKDTRESVIEGGEKRTEKETEKDTRETMVADDEMKTETRWDMTSSAGVSNSPGRAALEGGGRRSGGGKDIRRSMVEGDGRGAECATETGSGSHRKRRTRFSDSVPSSGSQNYG